MTKDTLRSAASGFTLIEALIVVSILSVLIALAAPSLTDFLEDMQSRQNTNELLTSLLLARSEAVTRNRMITLCTASGAGATTCDASAGWHDGWLGFEDLDGDGSRDVGEQIVDQHSGLASTSVVTSVNFGDSLTYLPSGAVSSNGTFNLCAGGDSARSIVINAAGRPRLTTTSCL